MPLFQNYTVIFQEMFAYFVDAYVKVFLLY